MYYSVLWMLRLGPDKPRHAPRAAFSGGGVERAWLLAALPVRTMNASTANDLLRILRTHGQAILKAARKVVNCEEFQYKFHLKHNFLLYW